MGTLTVASLGRKFPSLRQTVPSQTSLSPLGLLRNIPWNVVDNAFPFCPSSWYLAIASALKAGLFPMRTFFCPSQRPRAQFIPSALQGFLPWCPPMNSSRGIPRENSRICELGWLTEISIFFHCESRWPPPGGLALAVIWPPIASQVFSSPYYKHDWDPQMFFCSSWFQIYSIRTMARLSDLMNLVHIYYYAFFFWMYCVLVGAHGIICSFFNCSMRDFSCSMQTLACSLWDLIPWPGIKPKPPALEVWSLSHWTAREVPILLYF